MVVGSLSIEDYRQILVQQSNLIELVNFNHLIDTAQKSNRQLEPLLIEKAFISPSQFLQLASTYFNVKSTNLKISDIKKGALSYLNEADAVELLAIPFDFDEKTIKLAVVNPRNTEAISKLRNNNQLDVEVFMATELALRRALTLYDPDVEDILKGFTDSDESIDENTASQLATSIIEAAVILEASDVHIEPYEDTVIVRLRVDGLLRQLTTLPVGVFQSVLTTIKIKAALRIDQTRLPQDGRFSIDIKGQEVNIRISVVPSLWGEKIVLRVLLQEAHLYDLENLGFLDSDLAIIHESLKRPFGMVLVSGPTGSGKTTTLYAFLQEIGMDRVNIVNISTIEDPIEYTIPRVTQIQTQPDINLTFATGLRALLRQDPDIIMVGEIRDEETADIAVRAALVGRMLMSSIHTNDAAGVVPRLLDMGIEPYLVSSTLAMVVSQRLARKLCTYCRQSHELDDEMLEHLNNAHDMESALATLQKIEVINTTDPHQLRFFKAVGCDKCDNSGYSGRVGLYEILQLSDPLRAQISKHTDSKELKKTAIDNGMKTMFEDGLAKVTLGIIDIKELMRVVYD